MGLFNKKKKKEEEETPVVEFHFQTPCERGEHLYRDFPPYLVYNTEGNMRYIKIKEPYVCTLCGKRVDKILEQLTYTNMSYSDFNKEIERKEKEYEGFLKPLAIVEDMVQDQIHVDRLKLQCWDKLHSIEPQEKEPFTFQVPTREI
jgi:hypothetical protein